MRNTNFYLLITLLVFIGVIFVQVKLSSTDSKFFGLILPGISFILLSLGSLTYDSIGVSNNSSILSQFFGFLIANIPTFIFLAIYFGVREKNRVNKQIEKMNIKDL
ncbi:hypothetical protein JNO63_03625 [Anaerococcus sp. mt242]|uniref:hypothetical protein n=1 Tax=Anaerococcus sp. mt242 TaxID=2661917 RepID=UPI0019335C0B|nr:hypothetical protein [Anaerococcus sp. mt242]MBM0046176.1 hypothetical protein [Anaerococcus sp. mt242]